MHDDFDYKNEGPNDRKHKRINHTSREDKHQVSFKNHVELNNANQSHDTVPERSNHGINTSSENIHFESNDLLDEYKK